MPVWIWSMAGGLAGLIAGSFLATLAIRWERGEQVSAGRSRCDGCGGGIGALALVPVMSFVALRGRCTACGAVIDPRHPVMELGCGLIGAAGMGLHPDAGGAAGALFGWMLATLALLDLNHHWLPDKLTIPLALFGLAGGGLGQPPAVLDRLIGAAAGWAALTVVAWSYRRCRGREGLGGGDPKFLGAIGAWLGWRTLPLVVFVAAIAGLVWCAVRIVQGRSVALTDRLPLGTLLALAAWPLWLAGTP